MEFWTTFLHQSIVVLGISSTAFTLLFLLLMRLDEIDNVIWGQIALWAGYVKVICLAPFILGRGQEAFFGSGMVEAWPLFLTFLIFDLLLLAGFFITDWCLEHPKEVTPLQLAAIVERDVPWIRKHNPGYLDLSQEVISELRDQRRSLAEHQSTARNWRTPRPTLFPREFQIIGAIDGGPGTQTDN